MNNTRTPIVDHNRLIRCSKNIHSAKRKINIIIISYEKTETGSTAAATNSRPRETLSITGMTTDTKPLYTLLYNVESHTRAVLNFFNYTKAKSCLRISK